MSITNIISAIGNNSSIYPLLVRDCGIEVPAKIYLTYKENKEDKDVAFLATRERFIDEYSTSAVWLGGIPFVEKFVNKYVIEKKGFNPLVNLKLFNESDAQGLDYNIKLYKEKIKTEELKKDTIKEIEAAIKDMEKVKGNKTAYEKLLSCKFLAATTIPIAVMGFILPKMIFAMTARTKAEKKAKEQAKEALNISQAASIPFTALKSDTFNSISFKNQNSPTFTGNAATTLANLSTYQKMATIDGGYAVGRVVTARNKNAAVDVGFKMLGMMFLNFVAPKWIEKILDSSANKIFNLDVKLDPIMLADKEFLKQIADKTLKLPKANDGKTLLKFIDENPDALFTKYASKFDKIKLLKNGIRDPRAFVDIESLAEFKKSIEAFEKKVISTIEKNADAKTIEKQIEKFAKKAKYVKSANILANVGLSSFLLAYALPKAQYTFREWYTGSKLEPGIADGQ